MAQGRLSLDAEGRARLNLEVSPAAAAKTAVRQIDITYRPTVETDPSDAPGI